ncbi:MAG: sigma factor-like helix-turn-helix DNA-binding protein, partial [Bradymonadaceae bacterium]
MLDFLQDEAIREPLHQAILLAALVAARILPIVHLVPFLGGKAVPQPVQIGLAMALAMLVYPAVWLSGAAAELPTGTMHITILVLKELEGFRYQEIASILEIPEGTVASRLYHARRALRDALEEMGAEYP